MNFTIENPVFKAELDRIIETAFWEDSPSGDITSLACIKKDNYSTAQLIVKEKCVLAGIELSKYILKKVDSNCEFSQYKNDGDVSSSGEIAFTTSGNTQSLLKAERVLLNFMQRMSGIATLANRLTRMIQHTNCILLDTRKTTPGIRMIEKWAVEIGGAKNHRFGLSDMIMIKDNHIKSAGGITQAINLAKKYIQINELSVEIEVETRTIDEINEIILIPGIHRIMLDNFSPDNIQKCLKIIDGKIKTEASGGISEENIVSYAETGVDYISCGALTHSVKSTDLSFKIV